MYADGERNRGALPFDSQTQHFRERATRGVSQSLSRAENG